MSEQRHCDSGPGSHGQLENAGKKHAQFKQVILVRSQPKNEPGMEQREYPCPSDNPLVIQHWKKPRLFQSCFNS